MSRVVLNKHISAGRILPRQGDPALIHINAALGPCTAGPRMLRSAPSGQTARCRRSRRRRVSLIASAAPDCICSFAPSLINLAVTDGTSATRRSCGWVPFNTATLTYIGRSSCRRRYSTAHRSRLPARQRSVSDGAFCSNRMPHRALTTTRLEVTPMPARCRKRCEPASYSRTAGCPCRQVHVRSRSF